MAPTSNTSCVCLKQKMSQLRKTVKWSGEFGPGFNKEEIQEENCSQAY